MTDTLETEAGGTGAASVEKGRGLAARYREGGRRRILLIALSFALLMIAAASVSVRGINDTSVVTLALVLMERASLGYLPGSSDEQAARVLLYLRLPRVVMALVAGAALSVSGVLMQAITRNPLVSPYTIGVSSAAGFGASVAIMFGIGLQAAGVYFVPLSAFVCALLCAFAVFSLSWWRGMGAQAMILTGIALMYLFSALTAAVQFVATEEQLARVVHWTFGSLNGVQWDAVYLCAAVLFAVLIPIQARAWQLNALTVAGDDVARSLGVDVRRLRTFAILFSVVSAASVISFVGVIGFVGLIGPHLARMMIGGDHRLLLPFAAICGAALLLAADTIGRLAFSPTVLPVGIVVAFVGVPVFLHLIVSRRREAFA
ncbi:iron complex transport system permease protein [Nitratireductor aquibiodomus]|uniref:Iron complex transport system permease protein n=1 Tax=Nitratireductor aquibiodomus TaxID=204799 RepID=A0A1H4JBM9_9HYPH|nr:iron ABC transporter permease [Nitratireductor aquibiodomus]SEB43611.1 iron complex transport system permease protein [Nitratireductor aquibiodomus]